MTSLNGKTICGKRGGPNFIKTQRVDPNTASCPEGTIPCSEYSDATDTVCMSQSNIYKDFCPILDIVLIHRDDVLYYGIQGYNISVEGWPDLDNPANGDIYFLAFSKHKTREDVGYGPVISTTINTQEPCYGEYRDSLILSNEESASIDIPFERTLSL